MRDIGRYLKYLDIKIAVGGRYLTWDEMARHSVDFKLICALFSPVKLEEVRSLIAHFSLKLENVARFCVPSSELLALWSF